MRVVKISSLASIQDLGRNNFRPFGVNESGAMDSWSLMLGNALLCNDLNTPAIEVFMGGIELFCDEPMTFCISGANYEAYLNDTPIYNHYRLRAKAGDTIKLIRAKSGMIAYICVYGGIKADYTLESFSTNLSAGFGGYKGRALKIGDEFGINSKLHLAKIGVLGIKDRKKIRIIKNSEYELFSDEAKNALTSCEFNISSQSNRMGYRLQSYERLHTKEAVSIASHGVKAGTIQVPPSGEAIVLLKDAQTTGGYPKIASVIEADLGLFAQKRFNSKVQFELVSIEEALWAKKEMISHINQVKEAAIEN